MTKKTFYITLSSGSCWLFWEMSGLWVSRRLILSHSLLAWSLWTSRLHNMPTKQKTAVYFYVQNIKADIKIRLSIVHSFGFEIFTDFHYTVAIKYWVFTLAYSLQSLSVCILTISAFVHFLKAQKNIYSIFIWFFGKMHCSEFDCMGRKLAWGYVVWLFTLTLQTIIYQLLTQPIKLRVNVHMVL